MANPYYATYTLANAVVGPQAPANMDYLIAPFSITAAVYADPSVNLLSYSIEWSLDPEPSAANARWFTDPTLTQWQTKSGFTFIQYPVRWLRINLNNFNGPVELKIIQGLSIN